jgi:hypothetical protein
MTPRVALLCGLALTSALPAMAEGADQPKSQSLRMALATTAYGEGHLDTGVMASRTLSAERSIMPTARLSEGPVAVLRADVAARRLASESQEDTIRRASDPLRDLDATDQRSVTYGFDVIAPSRATGLPVDVQISPRATIQRSRLGESLRRGAEVRLGLDLEPDYRDPRRRSMYLFAGAENQVLTYDLRNGSRPSLSDMKLEDKLTVGDVQAGVAVELYRIQGSVSLLSREFSAENASVRENYAAFTVTFRR